ncbi:hypothetical protein EVAR_87914_1 [Eumeta japonica]|uniref:Uncharacterized protein n=1 Tax=Eumeta variegata TaxID=151549 RepID=A0A4C1WVD5_EUMVA|nr:hypothetical protein EVAR_87914_1 [Eumeta japonica]
MNFHRQGAARAEVDSNRLENTDEPLRRALADRSSLDRLKRRRIVNGVENLILINRWCLVLFGDVRSCEKRNRVNDSATVDLKLHVADAAVSRTQFRRCVRMLRAQATKVPRTVRRLKIRKYFERPNRNDSIFGAAVLWVPAFDPKFNFHSASTLFRSAFIFQKVS